jgi:iron complex transport system substrate-binding protein
MMSRAMPQKHLFVPRGAALAIAALLLVGGRNGLAARGREESSSRREAPGAVSETGTVPEEKSLYWQTLTEGGQTYVVDGAGNRALLAPYRRVILTSPGAVEVFYMIGAESAIAGITSGRDPIWPEDKTVLLPSVGNTARPSLEAVVALNPDLIIGNAMNAGLMADLASRNYTVLIHNADSLADIFNSALILGRFAGKEEEARRLVEEKQAQLASLRAELRDRPLRLKGAFLYSVNPISAFTSRSLAGEILEILGVENIAGSLNAAQPILSPEYILAEDPDFLFGAMSITKTEDILAADSVIMQTRAGREGNISIVPSSLFLRTSPRIVESLLELYGEVKKYARPEV